MAKERTGYVFENNGKWYARITFKDANGNRRNIKRTVATESAAKKMLRSILRELEIDGDQTFDKANLTFQDLVIHYEKHFCQPAEYVNGRKISGLRDVGRAKSVLPHFRKFFGQKRLRAITYGDLTTYKRQRMKVPTHQSQQRTIGTMNRELGILRRMFSIAVAEQWLLRNPFNSGDPLIEPSGDGIRQKVLTLEEEVRLFEALNEPCRAHIKPIVICLLDTGARRGEMLKLVWQDVNFENRIITIRSETTKTLKERKVGVTSRMYEELIQLWQNSNKDLSSRVFNMKVFRKSFATACKIAGIKVGGLNGLTIHSLRHSTAKRLIQGQMPIQLVGRILGHSNVNTTYRYLSINEETVYQATSILEAIQCSTE
jgi:integrase